MYGEQIRIEGTVQGVGFRPYIWRLAHDLGVIGWVKNDGQGVLIEAWGDTSSIQNLRENINQQPPRLANIKSITSFAILKTPPTQVEFTILSSTKGAIDTHITDDASLCNACKQDIFNPETRHYRYPFTNCTHCGPRLTITKSMPYDRHNTTMSDFVMCVDCEQEYHQPMDRRFHAQPNSCPVCGPKIWLENSGNVIYQNEFSDDIEYVSERIKQGDIVAIKSLGGFRLACDARNQSTIKRLRTKKNRPDKPLALMARDTGIIKQYATANDVEKRALEEPENSIVLLEKLKITTLPDSLAPKQNQLGFMLPGTAFEHILFETIDFPVVMTSGNISGDPQCTTGEEARAVLSNIADLLVMNDREIKHRVDDSLIIARDHRQIFRRSRGFCSSSTKLPFETPNNLRILATGAELKNTFCLIKNGNAFVSKHLGDLKNSKTWIEYQEEVDHLSNIHDFKADIIAVDLHSNYLSTQYGNTLSQAQSLPVIKVQHHHAHIAAVMVEHGLDRQQEVLGIILDGMGAGENGEIWGGELLHASYSSFERVGRFKPVALPGADQAMRQPWRNLLAQLISANLYKELIDDYKHLDIIKKLTSTESKRLKTIIEKDINSPLASSAGRLFDAVAAALDICPQGISYEGQAAMELEAMAETCFSTTTEYYQIDFKTTDKLTELSWKPLWIGIFYDLANDMPKEAIAAKFHLTMIHALSQQAVDKCRTLELDTVVLTGGVFQNQLLLNNIRTLLEMDSLKVLSPSLYPTNDGGISLGQAVVAAARV